MRRKKKECTALERVKAVANSNHAVGLRISVGQAADMESVVRALIAMIMGLANETRSPDAMYLAMHQAQGLASGLGLTEDQFKSVAEVFCTYWYNRHSNDPFSNEMFGVTDFFKRQVKGEDR